jgi:hypothetical protein
MHAPMSSATSESLVHEESPQHSAMGAAHLSRTQLPHAVAPPIWFAQDQGAVATASPTHSALQLVVTQLWTAPPAPGDACASPAAHPLASPAAQASRPSSNAKCPSPPEHAGSPQQPSITGWQPLRRQVAQALVPMIAQWSA